MKRVMLSCIKATELIEKKLLFPLSFKEKIQLILHKSACKACANYEKQSELIDESLSKHFQKEGERAFLTEEQKKMIIDKVNR